MIGWLKTLLTENLALKAISLALAFAAWAVLARDTTTLILITVPIEFGRVPAGTILSADPTEVQLLLRGPRSILRGTRREEIHLPILQNPRIGDWSPVGYADLPMDMTVALTPQLVEAPAGVTVLQVHPAQTRISLTRPETAAPPAQN